MVFKNVIFTVFIVFQAFAYHTHARTNQDVIDDFKPTFDERHNAFYKFQKLVDEKVPMLLAHMEHLIEAEKCIVQRTLENNHQYIEDRIVQIIKEAGLTGNPGLTEPCMTALNKNVWLLEARVAGCEAVCVQLAQQELNVTQTYAQTLITQLNNEHYGIDITKEECVKYGKSNDVQECVIGDLYTFFIPYIKDVEPEITKRIEKIGEDSKTMAKNIDKCDHIIQSEILSNTKVLLTQFIECIAEIKN